MLGQEAGGFLHYPFPVGFRQPDAFKIIGIGSEKGLHRLPLCFRPYGYSFVIHEIDPECVVVHEGSVRPGDRHLEVVFCYLAS